MKEIRISLSKHAKQRYLERNKINIDEIIIQEAFKAFNNGEHVTGEFFQKTFDNITVNSVLSGKGFFTREYRKYKNLIYVFGGKTEAKNFLTYRLITVLPINQYAKT